MKVYTSNWFSGVIVATFLLLSLCLIGGQTVEAEVPTIEFWWPAPQSLMAKSAEMFVEQINAEGKVKINLTAIPWSDYFTKLNAGFASGAGPDIFGCGYGQMGAVAATGNLLPLTEDLKAWDEFEDFYESFREIGTYKGEIYAMLLPESRPLMYRADKFQQAGLDPNVPPASMQELREYAKKLTERDATGDIAVSGFGFWEGSPEQIAVSATSQFGETYLWDEDGNINTSPGIVEGLKFIQDMIQQDKTILLGVKTPGSHIVQGKTAMTFRATTWDIPLLNEQLPGQLKISPPPEKKTLVLGVFVAANANTEYKKEVVDVYKRFFSAENLWHMADAGFIPTRKSMAEEFIAKNPEQNGVVAECMDYAFGYKNSGKFFDVLKVIRPRLEKMWLQNGDVEVLLQEAAKKMELLAD